MAVVGTAVFKAIADFGNVIGESKKAGEALGDIGGQVTKSQSKTSKAFGNIAKGATLAGSIVTGAFTFKALSKGMKRLVTLEDSTAALTVQFKDAGKAADFMGEIAKTVSGTPYNLDAFAAAGAQLVGYGVEAEKIPGYLTAIGEAAASKGGQAQEYADRMSESFGRMSAAGKIGMDDVNRMSDVGVNALAILGNAYGVSAADARKMISSGLIPATEAMDHLADGIMNGSDGVAGATNAFAGTMEALRNTMSGSKGGFESAVGRFGAKIIEPWVGSITAGYTAAAAALDWGGGLISSKFNQIAETEGYKQFQAVLEHIPQLIQSGFTDLGPLERFRDTFESVGTFVDGVATQITDGWKRVKEEFGGSAFVEDTLGRLSAVLETIMGIAERAIPPLVDIGVAVGVAASKVSAVTWQILLSILESLVSILDATLVPALEWLADLMTENEDAVTKVVAAFVLWKTIGAIIGGVVKAVGLAKAAVAAFRTSAILAAIKTAAAWAVSTAQTVALFAMYAAQAAVNAAKVTAAWVASSVRTGAAFVAMSARSVASAVASSAAWVLSTARVGVALAVQSAALLAGRAAMVASAAATKIVTAAQWLWNAALTANPIGLIVAAIALFVGALVWLFNNNETVRNAMVAAWEWIKNAVTVSVEFIKNFLSTAWEMITTTFTAAWDAIKAAWQAVWDGILLVLTTIWDLIVAAVTLYIETVMLVITTVLDALKAAWDAIWNGIKFVLEAVWDGIVWYVTTYINTVKTIITTVINAIKTVWNTVWNAIKTVVTNVWNGIKSFVSNAINAVKTTVSNVVNTIKTLWSTAWEGMKTKVSQIWDGIKSGVRTGIDSVMGFVRGLKDKILNVFSNAGTMLLGAGKKIISGLWDGIKGGFGKIKDGLAGLTAKLPSWKGPEDTDKKILTQSGVWVIEGFVDGLEKTEPLVQKNLSGLTDSLSRAMTGIDSTIAMAIPEVDVNSMISSVMVPQTDIPTAVMAPVADSRNRVATAPAMQAPLVGELTVNNPKPERTSDTLAKVVRKRTAKRG